MKPLDPRLLAYASASRAYLVIGGLLGFAQSVLTVAVAWFLSQLVVQAVAGAALAELSSQLLWLALCIVARSVAMWLLDVVSARGAARVKSQLRRKLLDAIASLGPSWLAKRNSAQVVTIAGTGLDSLDNYFSRYLPQLILTAIATPIIVGTILLQDVPSAVSILITLPIIPVFMILIGWATQSVQKAQWKALGSLAQGFLDVVGGLATLKLFGRQNRQAARIQDITEQYRSKTMGVLRVSFLSGFVLELASSLAVAIVAVSIGIRLIDGSLALSVGLFVLLLAPEAFLPLRNVGVQFHSAADGVAAADDVFAILDEAKALPTHARSVSAPDDQAGLPEDVVVQAANLAISYDERQIVDGLNFALKRGEITALVGPSGIGKSSIAGALLGFVPYTGSISFAKDSDEGASEPAVRDSSLNHIAWAGQRPALLQGTVADNVSLGTARTSQVEIQAAVRAALALAAAADIDPSLALGVAGAGLSGGQAQRVGIARAFYRAAEHECPLIILDEPSSALDGVTEQALIANLRILRERGHSILAISHRRAIVALADHRIDLQSAVPQLSAGTVTDADGVRDALGNGVSS